MVNIKNKFRNISTIFLLLIFIENALFSQGICQNYSEKCSIKYSIKIENHGNFPIDISNIWDSIFFPSEDVLITYINKRYSAINEDYIKAWRFIIDYSWNVGIPITSNVWYIDPLLFLNSFGSGFCYHRSVVLAKIWNYMGYESRVWNLSNEHTVPEIYINKHWEMYDPTFHCFYSDSNESILGVLDVVKQPNYITKPYYHPQRIKSFWSNMMGYSNKTKKIYLRTNKIIFKVDLESKEKEIQRPTITLLPHSYIIFPFNSGLPVKRDCCNYKDNTTIAYANLAVYIPAGQTGEFCFPLIFHGACSDSAMFEISDKLVYLTSTFKKYLSLPYMHSVKIKLVQNYDGIWFYYFVNPLLIEKKEININNVSNLVVTCCKIAPSNQIVIPYLTDVDKPMGLQFIKYIRYLYRLIQE